VVRARLGRHFSGQKARNEETGKGCDRCRDRGQQSSAQQCDGDPDGDTREDRGPTEMGHLTL
jgi:hypothetical protein